MLPLENIITVLFNWKLILPCGDFKLLKLLKALAEKGTTIMVEVMDVIYQQEIRLLPHKGAGGGEHNYFWNLEVCLFFFPSGASHFCTRLSNRKMRQPNKGKPIKGLYHKIIHHQVKNTIQASYGWSLGYTLHRCS